jgi:hypothetical protein
VAVHDFCARPFETVRSKTSLVAVLDRLQAVALAAVTDPDGILVGLLTRQNLGETALRRYRLPLIGWLWSGTPMKLASRTRRRGS